MSRLALLEWLQTRAQLVQPEALAVEQAMEKEDLFYIDDLHDASHLGLFQDRQHLLGAIWPQPVLLRLQLQLPPAGPPVARGHETGGLPAAGLRPEAPSG